MNWRGRTAVIMASGPSLTLEDARYATRDRVCIRTIVINDTWKMCPWADALYAADADWWTLAAPPAERFLGERWATDRGWEHRPKPDGMNWIRTEPGVGVSDDPSFVFTGHNSSFQAMQLALHWGADRIVFLGLDMGAGPNGEAHWHGSHPSPLRNTTAATFKGFIAAFEKAAPLLEARGVPVFNASRRTALECFPRIALEDIL